jgi:hypothetical protein
MGKNIELNQKEENMLVDLLDSGPLWNEYIPDRTTRDNLIRAGLATKVVCRGNDHYTAATPNGAEVCKLRHGTAILGDAIAKHKTKKLMDRLLS